MSEPTIRDLVASIEQDLRAAGDPGRAVSEKRYLRSELRFYGAGIPAIRRAATALKKAQPCLGHETLLDLARELWSVPVHERRMAAIELLGLYLTLLEPEDSTLIERFLRESSTWAYVDPLSITIMGAMLPRFPALAAVLDRWSEDDDFWIRRAALLALLPSLRQGPEAFTRFARYADQMLEEREFFIRKAIGWVLRECGKRQPDLVYAWLAPRIARASGVTVREAVKYLPDERRQALLRAYRGEAAEAEALR
jgi:3-methyladenine DNA glycosylase AlkD